jgi:hypothetical protein
MPQSDPVAFAAVGFVPIHELGLVNALAETQIAKRPAGEKSNKRGGRVIRTTSSRDAFRIGRRRIGRRNRFGYLLH